MGPEQDAGRADGLLKQIAAETRRSRLFDLLSELQRVPTIPDCTVLLPLTKHRWWQVRWGAIRALAKCRDDRRAESALLAVLANPVDDYDRINANAALGQCGTPAAIPALAAQVHHPTDDVKCSAIYALAEIGNEPQLPVFLDALTDRSWAGK